MMTINTKLHYLNDNERKRLAEFLKNELGIDRVMYIHGEGTDIRLLSIVDEEVDE